MDHAVNGRSGRLRAALLVVLLAVAAFAGSTERAVAGSAPGALPVEIDSSNQAGWWKPLDLQGGRAVVIANRHLEPTSDSPPQTEHEVVVAVQEPDGGWTVGCMQDGNDPDGCADFTDDCGHNQPTVIVDGDGYLHAFVSMHNSVWRYYRSEAPGDPSEMVDRSSELPDSDSRVTYPIATRASNGDVYVAVRNRVLPDTAFAGRLYRWDDGADAWSRVATFARQDKHWVYPDDIVADDAGDIHLIYEWSYGGARAIRHLGSYLRYSPATGTFTNLAGAVVAVPATTASRAVYQPLEQGESATAVTPTAAGVQSAKLAIVPGTATPMIAYRYRRVSGGPFEVRRARPVAGRWTRETIYAGRYDTFAAIDITHDGNVVRVYFAKMNTRTIDQAFAAEKGASGGFVERSVAPGRTVERLSVGMAPDGTDHLYLLDAVDAPRNKADPSLSEVPPCLGAEPATVVVTSLPR